MSIFEIFPSDSNTGIPQFLKVPFPFMLVHFYERPMLVPIFVNNNKNPGRILILPKMVKS